MKKIFILAVFLFSCEKEKDAGAFHESMKEQSRDVVWEKVEEIVSPDEVPPTEQPAPPERKLIKNASLTLEVKAADSTKKKLDLLIRQVGGYISNENQTNYDGNLQYSIVVRVPAAKLEDFIGLAIALAKKVDNRNISTNDVTEEYIDTEARIQTKKQLEVRYHEILKQAKTVQEILSIESNLNDVRTEIESAEGKLNYLKSQVAMSTVNISYYQVVGVDFGFFSKLVVSFRSGWKNLQVFLVGMISFWPFLLLIAATVAWWKRRLKKKATASE